MRKMRKSKKTKLLNQKGFSLVEVLMAVVILGLIAAPIMQMLMTSYQVNKRSKRLMVASDISQTTMEAITALCWEDTSTLGGTEIKGVSSYYKSFTGQKPLYPNKITDPGMPVVYGVYAGKDDSHDNKIIYYFNDVKFYEYGDPGDGTSVLMESPAQNGEDAFQMEIEFLMDDYSENINSPSKEFYAVEVFIRIFDNDGNPVTAANRDSAPRLQVMNSAIVSKFRDDR